MRQLIPTGILASLLLAVPSFAQCAGLGNATLEVITKSNTNLSAGSTGILVLRGEPNTCLWLICDQGRGPTSLYGQAPVCLDLSPSKLVLDACMPASGVMRIPFSIPFPFTQRQLLCCQWVGLNIKTHAITISNVVCACANVPDCDSVNQLAYMTCFDAPSKYPVTITSTFEDGKEGKASVSFDPSKPPTYPITNGLISIEKISVAGGKVCVHSRINAGKDGDDFEELSSSTEVIVSLGSTTNSEDIHTSCSKPLSAGMVFGDFTITEVVDPAGCNEPCDGGINCLGYCTTVDAPKSYPVTVTSSVSEDDGKNASTASVSFDPMNPPSFPIKSSDGKVAITSIKIVGGKLEICSFADNGKNEKGELQKFPSSNMLFTATAGAAKSSQVIHVSCSKPIGTGSVFGDYEITKLGSVDANKCDGGINLLGLQTNLDQPSSYPVKVCATVSETDGKEASMACVSYDPKSPPSFPVKSSDGKMVIDFIEIVSGKIQVSAYAVNGTDEKGERQKFSSSTMRFSISAGKDVNSEDIHVSCSQPIGNGSVFGDLKVIALVPVN